MSDVTPLDQPIRRRQFFSMAANSALLTMMAALTGCGSGPGTGSGLQGMLTTGGGTHAGGGNPAGGNPQTPLEGTQTRTGAIDITQVGGTGLLVQSAALMNQPASGTDGSFSTFVSNNTVQLLLVQDGSAAIRAMALSQPDDSTLTINAQSTAIAMIFLTPGVLSTDPTIGSGLITTITQLPSFPPFEALVAKDLANGGVDGVAQDSEFLTLYGQVVTDLLAGLQPQGSVKKRQGSGGLTATLAPPVRREATSTVTITNTEFRFVSALRENTDNTPTQIGDIVTPALQGSQNPLPFLGQNIISGANVFDWGNIATGQAGSPGTATEAIDLGQLASTITTITYWVDGLATGVGILQSELPPATITLTETAWQLARTMGCTLLLYGLCPLLDVVGAGGPFLQLVSKSVKVAGLLADGLYQILAGAAGIDNAILGMVGAMNSVFTGTISQVDGNLENVVASVINAIVALVGAAATVVMDALVEFVVLTAELEGVTVASATLSATTAGALPIVLSLSTAFFFGTQLGFALRNEIGWLKAMGLSPLVTSVPIKLNQPKFTQSLIYDSSTQPGSSVGAFDIAPDGTVVYAVFGPTDLSNNEQTTRVDVIQRSPGGSLSTIITGTNLDTVAGLSGPFSLLASSRSVDKSLDLLFVTNGGGGDPGGMAVLFSNGTTPTPIVLPPTTADGLTVAQASPAALNNDGHVVGQYYANNFPAVDGTEVIDAFYWDSSLAQAQLLHLSPNPFEGPDDANSSSIQGGLFINDSDVIAGTLFSNSSPGGETVQPFILNFTKTGPPVAPILVSGLNGYVIGFSNSGALAISTQPEPIGYPSIQTFQTLGPHAFDPPTLVVTNTADVTAIPQNVNNPGQILAQVETGVSTGAPTMDFVVYDPDGSSTPLSSNGLVLPPTLQGGTSSGRIGDGGHVVLL
ncbi:MAG TPA: hypothetical protein VGO93_13560, partial [Candidatus Xenobia bacterium]